MTTLGLSQGVLIQEIVLVPFTSPVDPKAGQIFQRVSVLRVTRLLSFSWAY